MTAQEKKEKLRKEALVREYVEQIKRESELKYSDVDYDGSLVDYSSRGYVNERYKSSLGMFVKMICEEVELVKKGFPKLSYNQIIFIALVYQIIEAIKENSSY